MKVLNGFLLALVISVTSPLSYAAFQEDMCDGVLADEVASTLKADQSLEQIAIAAKAAGVNVECLVNALIDAEQDPAAVQAALIAAGYAQDEVVAALEAATRVSPVTSPRTTPETGGGLSNA